MIWGMKMEKPFDVKCLIDNGIGVVDTPNLKRNSINLVFEDGEKYKLFKPNYSAKENNGFVWSDEMAPKPKEELRFCAYEQARGNPLLTFEQVAYMSQIDLEIKEILSSYSEQ